MSTPRLTVTDALFGDLPPEARARFGLDAPDGAAAAKPRAEGTSNAAIKAAKAASPPPLIAGGPDSPWQLSRASWMEIARRVLREVGKDRVTSVSAGVTFFGILALFPALTALVSIYGLFFDTDTIVGHIALLQRFLPEGAVGLIRDQITDIVSAPTQALGVATVIGLLTALYSANGGMKALIEALNIAWFESESRGFIKLNLVSLAFTLGAIVLVIVMLGLVTLLPAILDTLPLGRATEAVVSLARWPLMIAALIVALAVLYRFGPNKENAEWQWISPGAVAAAAGLLIASLLFSWYAANFADYNETYGSLGAAIGLMMWLWIASMVVMLGAEINSEVERQIQKENGLPLEDDRAKDTTD